MFYLLQSAFSYLLGGNDEECLETPPSDFRTTSPVKANHPLSHALEDLIVGSGGSWPPRPTYEETWPEALKPYNRIFQTIAPHISVEESSLDDQYNRRVIDTFRARLRQELNLHIRLDDVKAVIPDENTTSLSPPAWMGFFSCITMLRQAYRFV